LTEAKETLDLLSGSIASAAGLGAVLGNLIFMPVKIVGGTELSLKRAELPDSRWAFCLEVTQENTY
jgi:hypothetical protein